MHVKRVSLRIVPVVLGALFLASCNGSSSGSSVLGNLPGPNPPPSFNRLFDVQCNVTKIYIIPPPIAAPLTPTASFGTTCDESLAFNASNGMLAEVSGAFSPHSLKLYNAPYSGSSTAFATIGPGGSSTLVQPEGDAWDGSGNVWVADQGNASIDEFSPPFSASNAPSATNTNYTTLSGSTPSGLAINPVAGLMFISDRRNGASATSSRHVYVVPAPYTGVPTADLTVSTGADSNRPFALAVDLQGRLFVGYSAGTKLGTIDVFVPPYATGNSPAFSLVASPGAVDGVFALAFDPAQNLYAQLGPGQVVVFNGPVLGAAAGPSANLGCPSGACNIWGGIAFGP